MLNEASNALAAEKNSESMLRKEMCNFSVDTNLINKSDIISNHKHLIIKNNIKKFWHIKVLQVFNN